MQLAFLVTFAFGVLSAWAIGSSEEEEQEWACGTDTVSHWLSEATIEKSCPTLKKSINQCCVNHDQCYEDQLGRTFCDDTFCKCLEDAAKPSDECSQEDAPTFCLLVREFGEPAYEASAKNVTVAANETMTLLEEIMSTTLNPQIEPTKIGVPMQKEAPPKVLRASRTAHERTMKADDVLWLSTAFESMD
ncbi:hypothetical protein L596_007343 [Steinernema carpocapsae]|uniref:Phospholipase A2 domain-containing protein n=1 Tax=Steinernema carpocapsae TaxID=34508 RepID=A0A4U5P8Z2_STECR|nr:hypothetical protein L596_007343 [Steinernema carpocapsae]